VLSQLFCRGFLGAFYYLEVTAKGSMVLIASGFFPGMDPPTLPCRHPDTNADLD
jgi:hypothetical protein